MCDASDPRCTLPRTRVTQGAEQQYAGEKTYTTYACGNDLPCDAQHAYETDGEVAPDHVTEHKPADDGWSATWPTEAGFFWVYGWPHGGEKYLSPSLEVGRARKIASGFAYVVSGNFVYQRTAGRTKWMRLEAPQLPVLDEGGQA